MQQNVSDDAVDCSFNTHALSRIAAALGNVGHPSSLPYLSRWNSHSHASVAHAAVRALRMYPHSDDVTQLLLAHLQHPESAHEVDAELGFDSEVVQHALDVLGEHAAPSPRLLHTLVAYLPVFDR